MGAWLSEAWQLFTENFGNAILMTLVLAVPVLIAAGIFIAIAGVPAALSGQGGSSDAAAALVAGTSLIGFIVSMAFLVVVLPALMVGIYACFWDMIQTRVLTFDRISSGLPLFGSAIAAGALFSLMNVIAGGVLQVIPIIGQLASIAIILPLMVWMNFTFYEMAVNRRPAMDCMSTGRELMTLDFWNLILLAFLCWLIQMAGGMLCGVGLLVAIPVITAAWGLAYRDTGA